MADDELSAADIGQVRELIQHLEAVSAALEPAYVLAGRLREEVPAEARVGGRNEYLEEALDMSFGRLGACTDLLGLSIGELHAAIGDEPSG